MCVELGWIVILGQKPRSPRTGIEEGLSADAAAIQAGTKLSAAQSGMGVGEGWGEWCQMGLFSEAGQIRLLFSPLPCNYY